MAKSLNGSPLMLTLMMVVLLTFPLAHARPRAETQSISEEEWQKALEEVIHLLEIQKNRVAENDSRMADTSGSFPVMATGPNRKKNMSQKRNAELINSLLGLPRIMKVVG